MMFALRVLSKADLVRKLSKGGCLNLRSREGVKLRTSFELVQLEGGEGDGEGGMRHCSWVKRGH